MKSDLSTGILLGVSGAGLFFGASYLPAEHQRLAKFAGLALAGLAAWKIVTSFQDESLAEKVSDAFFGVKPLVTTPGQAVGAPVTRTGPDSAPMPTPGKRFVIPVTGEVVSPRRSSTVNPSVWASTYPVTVRITNSTSAPITDVITVAVRESYGLGSDEVVSVSSDPVTVPAGRDFAQTLNVPIGGGRVRYSNAQAVATLTFGKRGLGVYDWVIKT